MEDVIRIRDISDYLENIAPLAYQESYDNSGLLTGNESDPVKNILISLDCTEDVVEEAIRMDCNLIIAHHPIIFKGLKKLTGKTYVERTIIKAVKNNIAIYAIHTNLDNVFGGVNQKIAEQIGLVNTRILQPKNGLLRKLVTFVPVKQLDEVRAGIFAAGGGHIGNYDQCSYVSEGSGTFRGNNDAKPFAGKPGEWHTEPESRLEVIFTADRLSPVLSALRQFHPYEEPAYDIISLDNWHEQIGAGLIGELPAPLPAMDFLQHLRKTMNAGMIRYTSFSRPVKKVAVCGGAGSFLLKDAIGAKADAFVTSDFKYHEFFDAEERLMIADIGHYESEFFTKDLLKDLILKKFHTFAVLLSEIKTNPINYY